MASTTPSDEESDPFYLDSIHPDPANHHSSRRPSPHQDLYLSVTDIEDLSQQPPLSPRHHQRNHTFDHSPDTPTVRSHARFAGGHDHSASVDSPLRPGFESPSFPTEDNGHSNSSSYNNHNNRFLDPSLAVRNLDQCVLCTDPRYAGTVYANTSFRYPRGHPAYSRPSSREREETESHGTLTPSPSHYHSSHDSYHNPEDPQSSRPASEQYDHYHQYDYSNRDSYSEYDDYDGEIGQAVEYSGKAMPAAKPADLRVDITTPSTSTISSFPKRSTSIKKGARKLRTSQPTSESPAPKSAESSKSPEKGSFWNWGKSRQSANMESPSTQFSDGTPLSAEQQNTAREPSPSPAYRDDDNYFGSEVDYSPRSASPNPYGNPGISTDVTELLKELQEVSAELAGSIRREMELEDEIDRAQLDMPGGPTGDISRRTSDYYSDSNASSAKLPAADTDLKLQGLERMRRKAEQEKAQLRVDMAQKVQEDLNQRRALEMHVQSLEEQLQNAGSSKELETQLEDYKRKLNDEKEFKANFDDLLAGMRQEIENMRSERDNLREEVVPKLRAQLEGMEAETSEAQNLSYENARLQQEVQNLKNENQTLQSARRLQTDSRFRTIAEEDSSPASPTSLSRSNSLARSRSTRARSGSLMGADSPRDANAPSESIPDRIKNIEEQRDALHRTLKSLLMRQDQITRKHTKQVRALETERDKALKGAPKRQAFHVEVQSLRTEINQLRQRADEALDQKFQCEKGLSGLKMDLDRAQQETSSLRELLQEHDIPAPASASHSSSSSSDGADSLDRAFTELRRAHADSVAAGQGNPAEARMQALASQVDAQQASNRELHARLAEAIARGEKEQAASTEKINELQLALRSAEERVMAAQSASEEAIEGHEETARDVTRATTDQAARNMRPYNKNAQPESLITGLFAGRSPKLDHTTSGRGMGMGEASRTVALEKRVQELEEAAVSAEKEMHGVVERMNRAQIEVADLQMQRDEAQRLTKMLQREIWNERERVGVAAA